MRIRRGVVYMATKVAISTFVQELEAALKRKDGYIMGSYG
jgi:short-subunit dehydrogenase